MYLLRVVERRPQALDSEERCDELRADIEHQNVARPFGRKGRGSGAFVFAALRLQKPSVLCDPSHGVAVPMSLMAGYERQLVRDRLIKEWSA